MYEVVEPAAVAVGFAVQELVQWRFGAPGLLALALLAIGVKTRNQTCSAVGAIALALLVSRPAL